MSLKTIQSGEIDTDKIEVAVKMILEAIGEDINREGILETPKRVAKMYKEVFQGLGQNPEKHLLKIFNENHEELVLVKEIPFYSMCEHHLVPFFGSAHIGYIPNNGKVTGLSKLARALETICKRPQVQERITNELANVIFETLKPKGVIVVIEAEHMCMTMRGVKKPGSMTITSSYKGIFKDNSTLRSETLNLIER
ncbi:MULTISPECIES: GTP cyclohydrolase I FolE [Bacillus cereus group]|uniref:GTP cyclohydrolase 1 n=1 Tax=Bacillus wiedmannii TaxID=1890302 RepID=A0A2A7VRC3_9BACI|nr:MULTISPECIES: GTP cyclohydrolase I FolE [Bacillus cereus group]AZJ24263.1 GTP cyclohydrolase I FolE [Bacillus wiedmannii bv. thuringiensis]KAA0767655.1 GTP cyclohydrolase I FolE [Bacillus sp. AR2-1]MCU5414345.1 GTP cyclohydrolase I FolE [Bacillus wiedmannii]MED3616102.1 GTP cyclohydrolase I FolE [Bacillus wiedmannii]PDY34989.1 GTP cyclohydrolase I FolE [Bacillus wiedmannii]